MKGRYKTSKEYYTFHISLKEGGLMRWMKQTYDT